jgi:hypothetical protein
MIDTTDTQAYYNGDFWEPMEPVSPGETPSEPKWRRLRVPVEIRLAVEYLAAAHLMAGDGMADQARLFMATGERLLQQASVQLANQQVNPVPFRVR